jgi:predicted DNA-binding protein YlxM (UPF0122 family)
MDTEEIKIQLYLRRRTSSVPKIAQRLGVTRQAVYNTIERRHKSIRIMQAVADAIERPLVEVWPELEDCPDGRASACN